MTVSIRPIAMLCCIQLTSDIQDGSRDFKAVPSRALFTKRISIENHADHEGNGRAIFKIALYLQEVSEFRCRSLSAARTKIKTNAENEFILENQIRKGASGPLMTKPNIVRRRLTSVFEPKMNRDVWARVDVHFIYKNVRSKLPLCCVASVSQSGLCASRLTKKNSNGCCSGYRRSPSTQGREPALNRAGVTTAPRRADDQSKSDCEHGQKAEPRENTHDDSKRQREHLIPRRDR